MQDILAALWGVFLLLCAIGAAWCLVLAAKHRKKWLPPLEELVTLDSRGWTLIATVTSAGAFVMILTSQLFSSSYWLALAVDSDGTKAGPGYLGWTALISVSTISALALSIIFELVSDIGAPTASGLKAQKKKGTPEFLLIVTALAIVMSLASKWGFYEDRRQARAVEAAQVAAADGQAEATLAEAQATIDRLANAPSVAIAAATEKAIDDQLKDLRAQRDEAIKARDALPENQGRNRLEYQATINTQTTTIGELETQKIAAQKIREDAAALAKAKTDKAAALKTIAADAGKITEDKKEIVKIGDTVIIRLIRAGLHQMLCFLFPIIALDSWATARKVKTREDAGKKSADTRKRNNPNAIFDADFEPPADSDPVKPFGGYLASEPPAEGEAPESAADADFEDDLGGEDDNGEGPEDAKT